MRAIHAENVSIRYITGDFKDIGLKEFVMRKLTGNYHVQEFWADRDVSFTLEQGDMLGIIGTNGAGKSTLLKAISGIMVPTTGSIECNGKIAALLELASGFDGDLTVRENTFLRGALLGYTREFMEQKYDEIIRFAELEDFQEHSFKQLSSGMKSRLAFSIACLVDPDILILDEVLSVGDGAFRDKSAKKMREILSRGVTGLLVSTLWSRCASCATRCCGWITGGRWPSATAGRSATPTPSFWIPPGSGSASRRAWRRSWRFPAGSGWPCSWTLWRRSRLPRTKRQTGPVLWRTGGRRRTPGSAGSV